MTFIWLCITATVGTYIYARGYQEGLIDGEKEEDKEGLPLQRDGDRES